MLKVNYKNPPEVGIFSKLSILKSNKKNEFAKK